MRAGRWVLHSGGPGFETVRTPFDSSRGARDHPAAAPESPEDLKLDDKLHQMLRELRRALSEAISESSDVNRTLRRIREEGDSLYLLVDCKRDLNDPDALALTAPRWPSTSAEPAFQIDGRDLSF